MILDKPSGASGAKPDATAINICNEGAYLLARTVIATWLGTGGTRDGAFEIAIQGWPSGTNNYVKEIYPVLSYLYVFEDVYKY